MKISDLIIIYLACGAPFGVFHFLQHRREKNSFLIYLKSISLFFVWIPYAVRLLHDFITKRSQRSSGKNSVKDKLENLEKQLSRIIFETGSDISLFDFREVFERYTGLTLTKNFAEKIPPKSSEEIFRVALRENIKLGAQCLHRRNLKRIEHHQNSARQDFVIFISRLNHSISETEELRNVSFELVKILNDEKALEDLQEVFARNLQREIKYPVQQTGEDLWIPEEHKQSSANRIPFRLRTLTALRKD